MAMLRTVMTESGELQGVPGGDPRITVFKGIPYAAPPVGELRWRAPQPVKPWHGVRKADTFPPIGYQTQPGMDPDDFWTKELNPVADECIVSEDCLYLNLWTPARAANEKLPIYVWIHGGGLESGYAWEMEFDGERMARQDMIFITVGYRLNVFGLLCHEEMESTDCGGANLCFLDMIAALQWIHRNIAAFGGDPARVTIGGQSGGALAVMGLITTPLTKGLISGAIAQSGGGLRAFGYGPTTATLREGQDKGRKFIQTLGCHTVEEARRLPAETVYRAFRDFSRSHGRMAPIVDYVVFFEDINEAVLNDHHHRIPYIFGSTSGEGPGTPAAPPAPQTMEEFRNMAENIFGNHAEKFIELCDAKNMEEVNCLMKLDAFCPRTISVRCYAVHQAKLHRNDYVYLFDVPIPGNDHVPTFHGSDMWFTFLSLERCWRPFTGKHYDLAFTMSGYIANFVKTGNPNGYDMHGRCLPPWNAYTEEEPFYLRVGEQIGRNDDPDPITLYRINYHLSHGSTPVQGSFK